MTKPQVVLLHGVGLDHTMWAPVARLLTGEYEVVAPDLPGHGARRPISSIVDLDDLAGELADQLPAHAHVVGFSLGALIAQHLARYRPDLVATLTSVSSVCQRTAAEREAVVGRLAAAETDFAASATASIQRWFARTDVAEDTVRQTEATLLANDHESFINCYRVFAVGDETMAAELGRIKIPALAVTGSDDLGSTPAMTRRLAAAMPHCRAVVVPHARHMLPVEKPAAFVDCLTTFIGDIHA